MKTLLTVDREIGRQLSEAALGSRSGLLTCVRGKLKRLFCVELGRIVFAASNIVEEQVGEQVLEQTELTPTDLAQAMNRCAAQKTLGLTRFLVEKEIVTGEQMLEAISQHIRGLLFGTLDWKDGECHFEPGQPDLDREMTAALSTLDLLLEYARSRPESMDLTRMRIGPPNAVPVLSGAGEKLLDLCNPEPATLQVLSQSDGTRSLSHLIRDSTAGAETTWRAIYGLVLCGILDPDGRRKTVASSTTDAAVSREEVLARLQRAHGADHYTVLELGSGAVPDQIRDAYYFLARRYHPDRFRAGQLQDLLPQIEDYFSKVTEAYNTLHDADLRTQYDSQLTESAGPQKKEQNTRDLALQNYARARTLIERGRYTDAVTSLENAIKLDAGEAKYHMELGRLLMRNPRRRPDAEQHLLQCNQLDPALVDGYVALGDLYIKMKRDEDAVRMFREALSWEPGHLEASQRLVELGAPAEEGGGRRGLFRG